MTVVSLDLFHRLRTENPIHRITIGKRRPQSGFQTADAKILSIGKVRPQYSYTTDSGLSGCTAVEIVRKGRSADRRRPSNQMSEAGAHLRVRPVSRYQRIRVVRQPEGPSPGTGDGRARPRRHHCALEHQHAKSKERMRADEHARGAERLARRAVVEPRAGRSATSAARIRGIAPPTPLAGGGATAAQSFRTSTSEPAPASSAARPSSALTRKKGRNSVLWESHASAMRAVIQRIWDFKSCGFVSFQGANG